ncbi:MAG: hypothetical protein IK143_05900 [Bacteroidales bacterium]|nr:hypothetical protein [Bacteroidales bacterium]
MDFKQLRQAVSEIRKALPWKRKPYIIGLSMIYLFTNGYWFKKLHGLEFAGYIIEEQWDGRWKVYYAEKVEEIHVKCFTTEEEACEYYMEKLNFKR